MELVLLFGEVFSIVSSLVLQINGMKSCILEIPNKGYKIDRDIYKEYERKRILMEKRSIKTRLLNLLFLLIPGFNIGYSLVRNTLLKKSVLRCPEIKEALIEMSDEEKKAYSSCKGVEEKLIYFSNITLEEKKEDIVKEKNAVIDKGMEKLRFSALPDKFSLDEVKRLNSCTKYTYRVGLINDVYTAVIGVPNPNSTLSRVKFGEDEEVHYFIKLNEDVASDKKFVVYSFMKDFNSDLELRECYNDIISSRSKDYDTGILAKEKEMKNKQLVKTY